MATRQYIGARYVPKFYENSDGTPEWRSGVIYEPLTIVTWNGNSYTSKKVVPASVGNPSDNSAYWVATGTYNEQVEQYRQETQAVAERMDELPTELITKKRAFLLQCDSLGIGIISSGNTGLGWRKYFKNHYGSIYDVYTTENVPGSIGAGITGFNSTNKHITNLRWTVENELGPAGKLNDITDLVVLSGTNDAAYGNGLYDAIIEFITYARSVFKNKDLRIVIGCCAHRAFDTRGVAQIYERACRDAGVEFAYDLLNIFASVNYNSDGTHYTQAGYDKTTPYICEYIITGKTDYYIDSDIATDHGQPAITYMANGFLCRVDPNIFEVSNTYLSSVHFTPTDDHVFHTIPVKEGTPLWNMIIPDQTAKMYKFPNEAYFRGLGDVTPNPIITGKIGLIRSYNFVPIAEELS